jgi:hypothetical protein
MMPILVLLLACNDSKDDSSGGGTPGDDSTTPDDSASDDSGTNKGDDSGTDDSATDDSATDDSATDDSGGCPKLDWYQDVDGDGYGAGKATSACKSPGKDWTEMDGDCDDALAEVNPGATEICNSIDDDCDTDIDDADSSVVLITWRTDADGDGYADPTGKSFESCTGAGGYAPDDATHPPDCNDGDNTVYPGAPELCDDLQTDCNTKAFKGDVGVATFYPASGGAEDWTSDMTGKYGAPAHVEISDDGELVICDGTWYVAITVSSTSATITGFHGSELTTLSGGDDAKMLWVNASYASVVAQGLTMIEGNDCVGAAVSTASSYTCSMGGGASWGNTSGVSLTLSDVRIEDNVPTIGSSMGAILLGSGNYLSLEDTTITNNGTAAVWAQTTPISCTTTDTTTDAGVWGNTDGVFVWALTTDPYIISSEGCDWEGSGASYTPYSDVSMSNSVGVSATYDFGDDADFLCDASQASCAK